MKTIKNIVIMVLIIGMFSLLPSCSDSGEGGDDTDPDGGKPHPSVVLGGSHPFVGNGKYCEDCGSSFANENEVNFRVKKVWEKIGYKTFNVSGTEVPGIVIRQQGVDTHTYILGEDADVKISGSVYGPAIAGFEDGVPITSIYQMQKIRSLAAELVFRHPNVGSNPDPLEKFWSYESGYYGDNYHLIVEQLPAVQFRITTSNPKQLIADFKGGTGEVVKYHFIAIDSNDTGYLHLGDSFQVSSVIYSKTLVSNLQNLSGYDKYVIPERHYYSFSFIDVTSSAYNFRASIKL